MSYNIHLVSDSTGETLSTIAKAVLVQYKNLDFQQHMHSLVRNKRQIESVYEEIKERPGVVLCTLYDFELKKTLQTLCDELSIPLIDPLDSIHQSLTSVYGIKGSPIIGGQHQLNTEYFERIDAMNYTLAHDDGVISGDLNAADVILVGVSRTSKTPTSIYLANRGIKTANIPFVNNIPLPHELTVVKHPLIVGLVATPERIIQIRKNRLMALNAKDDSSYVDKRLVSEEIVKAKKLFESSNWPVIDVTRKSIEETAAEVMLLLRARISE
ncbi:MAG: phosphoenolpyruvate synthase regulatory protein [Rhodobiaceae bacterium]|nr:phosphoenolpyruvate synthase regulatory protein [Rhodobiaceae bacterium]MAU57559.1 phosphoenolpyruvate synthase regulatory protein [Rhodobiaceae bacterium]OUT82391.1 MAG: phosphoenolpyruvate synthase regulatory protein [Rhizobiales bacterium TMED28]